MPITHALPAGFPTTSNSDSSIVSAADYAAEHDAAPWLIYTGRMTAPGALWAVPAAKTELLGATYLRTLAIFYAVSQVRLNVNVNQVGKGTLALEYSSDNGVNWNSLDGAGGPSVSLTRRGARDSGWVTTSATLRALTSTTVQLRLVGQGGDGVTAAALTMFNVWIR